MGYSTSSPPALVSSPLTRASGGQTWFYTNTDAVATVDDSGYITNGGDLGMAVGDLVIYYDSNLKITYTLRVHTVSSTAPGAVDLSDSTIIGVTTNTN